MASWNGAVASREEVREIKRRAALQIAARIFNDKGYHATSLDEIADQIGVTKAALYYYFKNKEQLLFECMTRTYLCGQHAQAEAERLDGPAIDKLRLMFRRFIENLMHEQGTYTTLANLNALPDDQRAELEGRRAALDHYSQSLLAQAVKDGDLRDVDVGITANFFLGSMNWILRYSVHDATRSPQDIAELFLDLFLNGVLAKS